RGEKRWGGPTPGGAGGGGGEPARPGRAAAGRWPGRFPAARAWCEQDGGFVAAVHRHLAARSGGGVEDGGRAGGGDAVVDGRPLRAVDAAVDGAAGLGGG